MSDKYILFSLEDDKSKNLGKVISSASCKKIVNFLAENEASETDISKNLQMPLNTVGYNVKKLLEAGIIEKSKDYFWSIKGKRIPIYKAANKLIVIAPKKSNVYKKIRSIIPSAVIIGIMAFIVFLYDLGKRSSQFALSKTEDIIFGAEEAMAVGDAAVSATSSWGLSAVPIWLWFLVGGLIALILIATLNWKKL